MQNIHHKINLQSILDLSNKLNETKDSNSILNLSLLSIIGKLGLLRGTAYLIKENKLKLAVNKGITLKLEDKFILEKVLNEYFELGLEFGNDLNSELISIDQNDFNKKILDSTTILIKSLYDFNPDLLIENNNISNDITNNINILVLINNSNKTQKISYIVPFYFEDNLRAIIVLNKKINNLNLSFDDLNYLNLVSNITSTALENSLNFESLLIEKNKTEKRNQLLQTLFEISKDFSLFSNQDNIFKSFSLSLMGQLQTTKFLVCGIDLNNKKNKNLISKVLINKFKFCDVTNIVFFQLIKQTLNLTKLNNNLNLIKDNIKDIIDQRTTEFNNDEGSFVFNNENYSVNLDKVTDYICDFIYTNEVKLIVPIYLQGKQSGFIILGKKLTFDYSDEEIKFIELLGNTALNSLENIRLLEEEIEKKKFDNEIKIALEIQKNLLPKSNPIIKDVDIAGITLASRYVGGDYYDYIKIRDNYYFVIIADATGKGIPASLLMANIQSAVKLLSLSNTDPAIIAHKLNQLICSNTTIDKFVSVFMGFIDFEKKSLNYVNAGHNPPFVLNSINDSIKYLSTENILIGVIEEATYNSKEIYFESGDILVMFTDGVVEADFNGEEYSEARFINLIRSNKDKSAETLINIFLKDINYSLENVNNQYLYDDVTKIIMKF